MLLKKKINNSTKVILGIVVIIFCIIIVQFLESLKFESPSNQYIPVITIENDSAKINKNGIDSILKEYPLVHESLKNSLKDLYNKTGVEYDVNVEICEIDKSINNQYFLINISENLIEIKAETYQGILNGIIRFENEAKKTISELKSQQIIDYSVIEHRTFHIAIRGDEEKSTFKEIIYKARNSYFNELIILVISGVELRSLKNNLARKWKKEDLIEIVNFAKKLGLKVIPEIKLLTHQEKLFNKSYPELMLNKTTYNPDIIEVYDVVFPLIDEILDIFKSDILSIGHDEVAGYRSDRKEKYILKNEKKLTPKQFLQDISTIHGYLSKKGVKTMMWGDMLLNPIDFPHMLKRHLHGSNGFSEILKNLPKDIILADWHYFEEQKRFSSYDYFCKQGFFTYGAVWKYEKATNNFTSYIGESIYKPKAIIATTWYRLDKKTEEINKLLNNTGHLFWSTK